MHVEHFMTKDPIACEVDAPVREAARLMREKGVGSVVVLQNSKVVGIVTDRDLATKVLAEGLEADAPVRDVMTPNPAKLTLDDNLFSVIDTFRSAGVVRRVPVVNANNELLGIVSVSDVAVIAKDLLEAVLLEETHHAMQEAKILTGGKRIVKDIRRPTKLDRLPPEQETRPILQPTPSDAPSRTQDTRAGQGGERKQQPVAARQGTREATPDVERGPDT